MGRVRCPTFLIGEMMQTTTWQQEKYNGQIFKLTEEVCPCVYTIADEETAQELVKDLTGQKLALVTIDGITWEDELSPWLVAKAFHGGQDFTGGADKFIAFLEERLVPKAEQGLGFVPTYRVMAGYSLAGLFSLYTLYKTSIFQRIVCASGSLWYDGFVDFMKAKQLQKLPDKIYLSLGDKEKITKNKRLAAVEERTLEAEQVLRQQGITTIFEKNQGGHFLDTTERVAKGIRWVLK